MSILLAKKVNAAWGGPFVTPYDVDDLPEDMLMAVRGLSDELKVLQKGTATVDAIRNKWLDSHPTYKKRG